MLKKSFLLAASFAAIVSSISPAMAGIVEKGAPTNGVYWAKEKGMFGKIYYECFDSMTNKKVTQEMCNEAKALKPSQTPK